MIFQYFNKKANPEESESGKRRMPDGKTPAKGKTVGFAALAGEWFRQKRHILRADIRSIPYFVAACVPVEPRNLQTNVLFSNYSKIGTAHAGAVLTNANEASGKIACFVDKIVKKCKKHEESGDKWGIVVYTRSKSGEAYLGFDSWLPNGRETRADRFI